MTIEYLPPTRPMGRLTPRQERFVREYASAGNAKRSAILAGYSVRSAKQVGSMLLKNPRVRVALKALGGVSSTAPKTGLTQAWAIEQLVQETFDPNAKTRLAAKQAVFKALVAAGAEVGEFQCPRCAQEAVDLNGLSDDGRVLRRLETTVEELCGMSPAEFEEWERQRRDPLVEAFKVARRVWKEGAGKPVNRDGSPETP